MTMKGKQWIIVIALLLAGSFITGGLSTVYGREDGLVYVDVSGSDDGDGTKASPYRHIQHGVEQLQPGDTLVIGYGVYEEKVDLSVSGQGQAPITLIGTPDEDGNLPVITQDNSQRDALLTIENQSHIVVKNLHFKGNNRGYTPMGILVEGEGRGYHFSNVSVSDIASDEDAHGIAFYGTEGDAPLEDIVVEGSRIFDCQLGTSEALVLNGNVTNFLVEDNEVYNNNNIGIDCIGFEGTAPANDQARNGVIRGNRIYGITTTTNAAYDYEESAGGIYVDGGKDILIENNKVTRSDIGIEIASEHKGKVTDGVRVLNNRVAYNTLYGIAVGGESAANGYATDNFFKDNVLVSNGVDIAISQAEDNRFQSNVVYTTGDAIEGDSERQVMVDNRWFTQGDVFDAGNLLQEAGIIQGVNGDLLRNQPMTREELVTVIWRLRGEPKLVNESGISDAAQGMTAFEDVMEDHWAREVIDWARVEGITLGIGNNQFGLGQTVTSYQVRLFMERTLSLEASTAYENQTTEATLRDDIFRLMALAIGESENPYSSIESSVYKQFQVLFLLNEA